MDPRITMKMMVKEAKFNSKYSGMSNKFRRSSEDKFANQQGLVYIKEGMDCQNISLTVSSSINTAMTLDERIYNVPYAILNFNKTS